MISYHEATPNPATPWAYSRDWKVLTERDPLFLVNVMKEYVWSPIIWQGGQRQEKSFCYAFFATLDFDDGLMTLEEAKKTFCDLYHVIGTTKSHQKPKGDSPACDRFRVLFRFANMICDSQTYRYNMKRLLDYFPADPQCKDAARFYFPCQEIVQANFEEDSYSQEVFQAPMTFDLLNPRKHEAFYAERFSDYFLNTEIRVGERNTACYRFAKDQIKLGRTSEKEIYDLIIKSKTYKDLEIPDALAKEISRAIKSAFKSLK